MENHHKTLTHKSHQIRTIQRNEQTWFVTADVCKALGYPDAREALLHLNPEEKNAIDGRLVNDHNMILSIISRSGLKKLVRGSSDPEANKFHEGILSQLPEEVTPPECHSKLSDIHLQNPDITEDILCKVQSLHLKALGKNKVQSILDTMQELMGHPKEYDEAVQYIDRTHDFLFGSMQEAYIR